MDLRVKTITAKGWRQANLPSALEGIPEDEGELLLQMNRLYPVQTPNCVAVPATTYQVTKIPEISAPGR
jgi:hypothetical protein